MKTKKRLLSILLSLALVMLPGMSLTAYADDTISEDYSTAAEYPLWVGGVQVTELNAANITGEETATAIYDANTNTLTLNGYTYSGEGHSYLYHLDDYEQYFNSAVEYNGDNPLTISLQGTNSITCTGDDPEDNVIFYGIRSKGGVTIDGTGSIAVNAKDTGILITTGDFEIMGGSVTVNLEDGYPVEVHGNMVIGENVNAVTIETSGSNKTGISIITGKDLIINGGTVQIVCDGQGGKAVFAKTVIISENVTGFTAVGAYGAFRATVTDVTVKNAIAGTGWTDVDRTEGKAVIAVSAEGQVLSSYKYVQFPGAEPTPTLPFIDVNPGDWFYDSVDYVFNHEIMTGKTPTYFGAVENLSRAQFATILYRIAGKPPVTAGQVFPDVPITKETEWYADAVAWANANEIILGYKDGNFGPADDITREQLAAILYRYAKSCGYDMSGMADLSHYPDAKKVSDWAAAALQWAVGNGIISGQDGVYLDPQGHATRAECAAMVERFMKKFAGV